MKGNEVVALREKLKLSQREFSHAFNISMLTLDRWESGERDPTGLANSVFNGLVEAVKTCSPEEAEAMGGRVSLGIGALIFHGLKEL